MQHYRNTGAADPSSCFEPPIPYIINGRNLVITQIRYGIGDSDASNYINTIVWFGQSAFNNEDTLATLDHNGVNGTGVGAFSWDHADITLGGNYFKGYLFVACICANAAALDIEYIQMEYYYT